MNVQNSSPITASRVKRAPRPRSLAIARVRAVSHFGRSSSVSDGSGRRTASGIEDLDQLARRVLAGEPQEDLLQPLGAGRGAATQLVHRPARADRPLRDDRDAVAQRLGYLER